MNISIDQPVYYIEHHMLQFDHHHRVCAYNIIINILLYIAEYVIKMDPFWSKYVVHDTLSMHWLTFQPEDGESTFLQEPHGVTTQKAPFFTFLQHYR
jgi:hypothetical protein